MNRAASIILSLSLLAAAESFSTAAVPDAKSAAGASAAGAGDMCPETASRTAAQAFRGLGAVEFPKLPPRAEARATKRAVDTAAPAPSSRLIRLSGNVSVTGTGYVPFPSGFATVTVQGYAQLWDDQGHALGSVLVSDTRSIFVSGPWVSGWFYPAANVALYEDGKYVGTVPVQGSILANGTANGGWLSLNGFGTVSGSGYIQQP